MKILIVDDEELTRTGLSAAVVWEKYGIHQVLQADDGVNGLRLALENHPDIILCDVRMPRMDGITMLERIEKENWDPVIIFMSGYSDKEYLKAAIQLKAIDYIEKPIEQSQLQAVIQKAVERCNVRKLQAEAGATHELQTQSELAYRFTVPYASNAKEVDELCQALSENYGYEAFKYITSFIVRLKSVPEEHYDISDIYKALRGFLKNMKMKSIYTEKRSYYLIFHVYGDICPQKDTLRRIAGQIGELVKHFGEYQIAIGDTQKGRENAYKSYSSAVILLQSAFFGTVGKIISDDTLEQSETLTIEQVRRFASEYDKAIEQGEKSQALAALEGLSVLENHTGRLVLENQIKAIYHDMLLQLFRARKKKGLVTDLSLENRETIMDGVEKCFFFAQLHEMLWSRTQDYFSDTEKDVTDNPTIRMIREYISEQYANPDLSVKSISDYVAMSTSYACTYFKNETGITINNYITDYRMKKAKQLLTDPRNKVNEISAKVGYSDGNYFAKSFRKYTGLSPSEYREQVIQK